MGKSITSLSELQIEADRLGRLFDSKPAKAVEEARLLRGRGGLRDVVRSLKAGILIDAGGLAHDRAAVLQGIKILKALTKANPGQADLRYNLANGLSQLGRIYSSPGPDCYVETHETRRKARLIFDEVARSDDATIRAKALINLGNELDFGFRWLEAYDCWTEALRVDESNRVAALSVTRMLLRRMASGEHPASLHRVAGYYARLANQGTSIESIAGAAAATLARQLPTFRSSWRPRRSEKIKDELGRFVATHRLALVVSLRQARVVRRKWRGDDGVGHSGIVRSGCECPIAGA